MFLIGIKTRLGGVILIINAARLLRESEIPRADAGGDHDLRFAHRINHRVFPHFGRQEKRHKLGAGRRHFFEPPHRQLIMTRAAVHWDNGPRHRGRRTLHKRIDVAGWIIDVAPGNVAGPGITYWRLNAVPDVHCHPQIRHAIGIGVVDRAHRFRTVEGSRAVWINHRRAAK